MYVDITNVPMYLGRYTWGQFKHQLPVHSSSVPQFYKLADSGLEVRQQSMAAIIVRLPSVDV
jgi:hypothetical protein